MAPIIKPEEVHSSSMPKRTVGKDFLSEIRDATFNYRGTRHNGVTPMSPAPGRGKGFLSETMGAAFNYGTRHNGVTTKSPAPGRGMGFWSETMGAAFNYNGNCSGNHNGGTFVTFESPSPTKIPATVHPHNAHVNEVAPIKEEIVHADDDYDYVPIDAAMYEKDIEIIVDKVMRNRGDKDLIQKINGLMKDNSNIGHILVNTQGNLESKEQQVQKLTNELSLLQIEIRSSESGLGNGNGTNSNALLEDNQKFAALQETCEGHVQNCRELQGNLESKEQQVQKLTNELSQLQLENRSQLLKSQHEYSDALLKNKQKFAALQGTFKAKIKECEGLAQNSRELKITAKKDQGDLRDQLIKKDQDHTKQVDKVKKLDKTISNMSDTSNKLQIKYQELDQKCKEVTKEKKTIDGVVKCLEKKILILRNVRNTKTEPPVVESVPQTEPPVFPSETAFPALPVALPVQSALRAMVPLPSGMLSHNEIQPIDTSRVLVPVHPSAVLLQQQQAQQQGIMQQQQHCLVKTSDDCTNIKGTTGVEDTVMQQKQQQVTTEQQQHCLAGTSDDRTHIEGTTDVKDTDMFKTDGAKFSLNMKERQPQPQPVLESTKQTVVLLRAALAANQQVQWKVETEHFLPPSQLKNLYRKIQTDLAHVAGRKRDNPAKSRKQKSWDRGIFPQNFAISLTGATAASSATPAASPYAFGSAEAPAPAPAITLKKKSAMESLEFSPTEKISLPAIKTKYRQLVLKYHPDKNRNCTPEYQAELSKKCREIFAARKFLRDYIFHSYDRNAGTTAESRPWIKQTLMDGTFVSQDDAMDLQEEDQNVKAENVIEIENKVKEDISCSWSKWLGFCHYKAKRKFKEFEGGCGLDAEKSKKEFDELSQKHSKDVEDLKKRMPHTIVSQSCKEMNAQIAEHLDKMKEQLKTRLLEDGEKCNKTVNEAETADELELDTIVAEEEIADVKDNAMETADTTAVENKSEIAEKKRKITKTKCRRSSRLRAKSNNCDHSVLLKEGHLNDTMIEKIQEKWKEVTQNWEDKVNSNKGDDFSPKFKVVDQDDNMETSG